MFSDLYWGGGLKIPSIRSNRGDSSTLLSSRRTGSRFAVRYYGTYVFIILSVSGIIIVVIMIIIIIIDLHIMSCLLKSVEVNYSFINGG